MIVERNNILILLICLFSMNMFAQVTLKPHYGLYLPKLGDVNSKISNDLSEFRRITGQPFPDAGELDEGPIWGVQIEYHTGEDYFFNANVAFYDNSVSSEYNSPTGSGERFNYERSIDMVKLLNVSGSESISVAANVFIGQTEAPLVVRPYVSGMTKSELLTMTAFENVVICEPLRTPVGAFGGAFKTVPANQLATGVVSELLERTGLPGEAVDDVIFANCYPTMSSTMV